MTCTKRYLGMRRKPDLKKSEKEFIENSLTEKEENSLSKDISKKKIVEGKVHLKWPFNDIVDEPKMEEGSSLRRPINLPLKEFEWNTLEIHTKKIGVGKTEWLRHAIYKLLIEEQDFYSRNID